MARNEHEMNTESFLESRDLSIFRQNSLTPLKGQMLFYVGRLEEIMCTITRWIQWRARVNE